MCINQPVIINSSRQTSWSVGWTTCKQSIMLFTTCSSVIAVNNWDFRQSRDNFFLISCGLPDGLNECTLQIKLNWTQIYMNWSSCIVFVVALATNWFEFPVLCDLFCPVDKAKQRAPLVVAAFGVHSAVYWRKPGAFFFVLWPRQGMLMVTRRGRRPTTT